MISKSKLFIYLKNLTKDDLKQIQKYIESPFFKVESRDRVIKLFEYIKKHHPNYDSPKLNNEALERKMKFTNFNNVKSNLLTCIEDYFKISSFQQDNNLNTLLFAKKLNELSLRAEFEKFTENEIDKLTNKKIKGEDEYYLKYKLLVEMYASNNADMISTKNSYLEDSISSLDHYYLYSNLKNLLAYGNLTQMVKLNSDIAFSKSMINGNEIEKHIKDFNVKIFYYMFEFNEFEDSVKKEVYYLKIKNLVSQNINNFSDNYKYEIYICLLNMAIKLHVMGLQNYDLELYKLHKYWIDQKVHLTHRVIHSNLFFNIVSSACNVEMFDWCQKFISNNRDKILNNEKEHTLSLSLAYFNLKNERYEDVISELNSVKFLNVQFCYIAKALEIQSLYEMKDEYRFEVYEKNFKNYIFRQKEISTTAKEANLNFIKILCKIEKARNDSNLNNLMKIKDHTLSKKEILHRPWLLKKIEELIPN